MRKFQKIVATIAVVAAAPLAASADVAHAVTLDANGATFRFGYDGQVIEDDALLGEPVLPGASLYYANVATIGSTVVDAVVTFVEGSNLYWDNEGEIERIDDTLPDDEEDPYIETSLASDECPEDEFATALMQIDFYIGGTYTGEGTGTPVSLSNLILNVYDIDGLQKIEVYGGLGYSVATNTHLEVTNPAAGTYVFASPDESTDGDDGTSYTIGRAKVVLATTSSVQAELAVPCLSQGGFDLDFSYGMPWTDGSGGGEDTTTLPPIGLPPTGTGATTAALIAAALLTAGWALTRVRRTAA